MSRWKASREILDLCDGLMRFSRRCCATPQNDGLGGMAALNTGHPERPKEREDLIKVT